MIFKQVLSEEGMLSNVNNVKEVDEIVGKHMFNIVKLVGLIPNISVYEGTCIKGKERSIFYSSGLSHNEKCVAVKRIVLPSKVKDKEGLDKVISKELDVKLTMKLANTIPLERRILGFKRYSSLGLHNVSHFPKIKSPTSWGLCVIKGKEYILAVEECYFRWGTLFPAAFCNLDGEGVERATEAYLKKFTIVPPEDIHTVACDIAKNID